MSRSILREYLAAIARVMSGFSSPLAAASCMPGNCPESVLSLTSPYAFTMSGLPQTQPIRQPVMLWLLESEWSSTATSFAPSTCNIESAGVSNASDAYAASETTMRLFCFANFTRRSKNSRVALAPVGLLG